MKYDVEVWSAQKLVQMLITGRLNPDPIGQRPAVTASNKKSIKIVRGMLKGFGCGMLTVRDIRNDPEAQKIYKCDYLVIDGGHRCRAIKAYFEGKFHIDGKFFNDYEENIFEQIDIPVDLRVCTAKEASVLFKAINTTTPTNFMEMIMSDEESEACKYFRTLTTYVKEYKNEPHPLFARNFGTDGHVYPKNFDNGLMNPRRRWDEYVAMATIRSMGKGLCNAGSTEIESLAEDNEVITKVAQSQVKDFLDLALEFKEHRKKTFNDAVFSAFFIYYFGLVQKYKKFTILNEDKVDFFNNFRQVYTRLTGNQDRDLENTMTVYEGRQHYVKEFVRKNRTNFANGALQQKVFELMEEFRDGPDCVTPLDTKRSLNSNEREEALAAQGFKCAIDGLPLELDEAVFGHDTPWCKGGESHALQGAMIREEHNRDMGTTTLDEYRMVLEMRAQLAKAS